VIRTMAISLLILMANPVISIGHKRGLYIPGPMFVRCLIPLVPDNPAEEA